MLYRVLADAVLIFHLAFVVFVAFGGFMALRWPRVAWLHIPAACWGVYIEMTGRICPLTPLENSLRQRGGDTGYSGGFIDHYITNLIYPDGLTRATQVTLGVVLLILNIVLYAIVFRRQRRTATMRA